jgi:hypothetical protein
VYLADVGHRQAAREEVADDRQLGLGEASAMAQADGVCLVQQSFGDPTDSASDSGRPNTDQSGDLPVTAAVVEVHAQQRSVIVPEQAGPSPEALSQVASVVSKLAVGCNE